MSRPLYRLQKSDVVDIKFTFSPEFDQTISVLPDGFIALKGAGDIVAVGLTVSELREAVAKLISQYYEIPTSAC